MADKDPDTADVLIAGRTVTVRRPTGGQATLAHRHGRVAQAALAQLEGVEEDSEEAEELRRRGFEGAAGVLDVLEYLVVRPGDREWLMAGVARGELDFPDFEPILTAFAKEGRRAKAKRVR